MFASAFSWIEDFIRSSFRDFKRRLCESLVVETTSGISEKRVRTSLRVVTQLDTVGAYLPQPTQESSEIGPYLSE